LADTCRRRGYIPAAKAWQAEKERGWGREAPEDADNEGRQTKERLEIMGSKSEGSQIVDTTALLLEIKGQIDSLLAAAGKEPIVDGALCPLKEVAQLCSCDYVSVSRAAKSGHLKTVDTPVGRQAWGKDVKAWINAGGKTGRSLAAM